MELVYLDDSGTLVSLDVPGTALLWAGLAGLVRHEERLIRRAVELLGLSPEDLAEVPPHPEP